MKSVASDRHNSARTLAPAGVEHGMARLHGGFPLSNRLLREMHEQLLACEVAATTPASGVSGGPQFGGEALANGCGTVHAVRRPWCQQLPHQLWS